MGPSIKKSPVANRENKQDRLALATTALAPFEPPQTAILGEPLRQAFASTAPADIAEPKLAVPSTMPAAPLGPQKPKLASKPQPQKSYALLSDVQIAGIKERLRLSSSQESYWPGVETALRAVARKIHAAKLSDPSATAAQLDPDCQEVQQLKSAAMPLLFQLREDQKDEVRKLARIIGLEKVASAI
jgi:ABC-type transporter Mla MlaB component